jgi:hypothetical protein
LSLCDLDQSWVVGEVGRRRGTGKVVPPAGGLPTQRHAGKV